MKLTSFTQNLPAGEGQDDVPALLRRIADTLANLGAVDVEDIVYHVEITADGEWPRMTVYYSIDEEKPDAAPALLTTSLQPSCRGLPDGADSAP